MKHLARYFITMSFVLFLLIFIDIAAIIGISLLTGNEEYLIPIGRVSDDIREEGEGYVFSGKWSGKLEELHAFLLIINEEGDVIWQKDRPEDVPEHYSLSDVAAFSRFYLKDYPVLTWRREEGILVIGLPRDTLWKYNLSFDIKYIETLMKWFPFFAACNFILLLLLPLWLSRKWAKGREKRRTEWIAGVSHDIRTPISIVMANAEKGGVIEKQCLRMKELVNNLNTDNKLEAGTGKWKRQRFKLAPLIRECVCDYMNMGEEAFTFLMDIEGEAGECEIVADEGLIRRMVLNLLSNAVRHNENGCRVTVRLKASGGRKTMLIVEDNGKGAAKDVVKKLNARLKHDYLPEHGLGIRVVKQVARKYRYKVLFSSVEGERFECCIIFR